MLRDAWSRPAAPASGGDEAAGVLEWCQREIDQVLAWLRREDFAGYEPHDGLESRLFRALPLAQLPVVRLLWLQGVKRIPVNLRPLLKVPRTRNPKTAGLVLAALARLRQARGADVNVVGDGLLDFLVASRSPGSAGWGYPFAWQNRAFFAPAYSPNAVATAFVVLGLLDYSQSVGDARAQRLAVSALPFFLEELRRSEEAGNSLCFSYTPRDRTRIHNVNLLVAAALARLARQTPEDSTIELVERAVRFSVEKQGPGGSWPYGEGRGQDWIDSFHTGFNLGALREIETSLGMEMAARARRAGYAYFRRRLLTADGRPRYYDRGLYPIDVHACAQAIITLLDGGDLDPTAVPAAARLAQWTRQVLGLGAGRYICQRGRLVSDRTVYVRWGQAWMLRALCELEHMLTQAVRSPIATAKGSGREEQ